MILQGSADVVDGFYATLSVMLALLAAGFAISSALRPHGEEDAGRLETLLATALPRSRWLGGHVAVTVVGTLLVLAPGRSRPRDQLRRRDRRRRRRASGSPYRC